MLKKVLKRGLALGFALMFSIGVVGCNKSGAGEGEAVYEVWTTYATTKVLQDVQFNERYVKTDKSINVKMAKGESEMGSLYITTDNLRIRKFELIPQELTNENGDVFSVEQMEVMVQKYIEVTAKSRGNFLEEFPVGCHAPDAIVDMELIKEAGENNVEKHRNQGFTVDFTTTADTPAGVYTGTFNLVVDEDVLDIPVNVTVWDYAIPAKTTSASCVLIYENQIVQGELTSVQEEVDDWYRIYYEQALNYKMNPYMVPESTKSPAKFVENVLRYYDDPNFNTYGLPHQTFLPTTPIYNTGYADGAGYFSDDTTGAKRARYYGCMDYWFDCLYLLGKEAAKTGKNYFEQCYIYPIDEPNDDANLQIAKVWMEDLEKLRNDVADKLINDGVLDTDSSIVASVRDIDILCTAEGDEPGLEEYDIIYVPQLHEVEDYSIQTNIARHADVNNNKLWYYTQIDPAAPAPSNHIDDFLVSGRILKWVQKYYNLYGWLYWSYNTYMQIEGWGSNYAAINPYEEINRYMNGVVGAMGDGFFVYPASRYGASEPIKSLRLLTYRDGQEDMDTLNYLESLFHEYERYYGLAEGTFEVNNILKGLYDKIFCRSTAFSDDEIFDECREALKDAVIRATKGDDKFIYDMQYAGKSATYTFYTSPEYRVKVGSTVLNREVCGEGYKYSYTIDASNGLLKEIELIKNDVTVETIALYEKSTERSVDMQANDFVVSVSEDSEMMQKDTGYAFTIKSNLDDYFIPQIKFTGLPKTFDVIELDLVNTTDQDVKMTLKIVSTGGIAFTKEIGLTANTSRTVEVWNGLADGSKVASVNIAFENKEKVGSVFVPLGDRTVEVMGIRLR